MSENPADAVVRRVPRARGKFTGRVPAAPAEDDLVARAILGARASATSRLSTNRVIAGDLPGWEPLPPGELSVRRPTP